LAQVPFAYSSYDLINFYTPAICGIGVAYVTGMQSFVYSTQPDTFAHEIGHNLGMQHSNTDFDDDGIDDEECESFVVASGIAKQHMNSIELFLSIFAFLPSLLTYLLTYFSLVSIPADGDVTCVMGYSHVSLRNFNAPHRVELGWIPTSNVQAFTSTSCTSQVRSNWQ
jgi:hypothetical protein